jgi:murein DD-endopeptidase MepM/ murein hydrolase activator NlpD
MSFVMIAVGPTSGSRVRTVPVRLLLVAGVLAASGLLAAGAGLGHWVSRLSAPEAARQEASQSASPFTVEQIGALSGRLFRLESQAGRLSERVGVLPGPAPAPQPRKPGVTGGSGGPMLPPRTEFDLGHDLGALATRLDQVEQQMALVADEAALQNLVLMRTPSQSPVDEADLASAFGNRVDPFTGLRAFHAGLDFVAPQGSTIRAAAGGTVTFAGFRPDYGWVVDIDHGNGLATRYAHASRLQVRRGDVVAPGDAIAAVGSTGRSTGPHLHFEVLRRGEAVDPRRYLAGL